MLYDRSISGPDQVHRRRFYVQYGLRDFRRLYTTVGFVAPPVRSHGTGPLCRSDVLRILTGAFTVLERVDSGTRSGECDWFRPRANRFAFMTPYHLKPIAVGTTNTTAETKLERSNAKMRLSNDLASDDFNRVVHRENVRQKYRQS